jgi:microcystin-dependent protein
MLAPHSRREEELMTEPYLCEIRIWAGPYPPQGWAFCDGAEVSIAQESRVFQLIGNAYGGDGVTKFKLPDLRGRVAVGEFDGGKRGAGGGEAQHMVLLREMPDSHSHAGQGSSSAAGTSIPADKVLATAPLNAYTGATSLQKLSPRSVSTVGGTPHENMSPFLGLNFCIAMTGIYPSRTEEA